LTERQIGEARRQLVTREDFGSYVGSDDFHLAQEMTQCPRLSGLSAGITASPKWLAPCAFLPEIDLGPPEDLPQVVASGAVQRLEGLRTASLVNVDPDRVWGCPECRTAVLAFVENLWRMTKLKTLSRRPN
jgi:hypothetical protein